MSTAERLQALHKRLGIGLADLSTEARTSLEEIVDLATELDLKDCSFTRSESYNPINSSLKLMHFSFLLAVSDYKRRQAEEMKEQLKVKRKTERQLELTLNASTKANLYHQ